MGSVAAAATIALAATTVAVASASQLAGALPDHILCLSLCVQGWSLPASSVDEPVAELENSD